jgi:transposase-like protein
LANRRDADGDRLRPVAKTAEELGISDSCLRNWIARVEIDAGQRFGLTSDERRELVELRRRNRVLEMENEIVKRASAYFHGEGAPGMTYAFIAERCSDLPVATVCRVMRASPSGYYAWLASPVSERGWADAHLTDKIVDVHLMSRRSYGSPGGHCCVE